MVFCVLPKGEQEFVDRVPLLEFIDTFRFSLGRVCCPATGQPLCDLAIVNLFGLGRAEESTVHVDPGEADNCFSTGFMQSELRN